MNKLNFPFLITLLASTCFLSGCSKSLLDINCQYQPVRGQMIVKKINNGVVRFSFQPSVSADLEWFKRAKINTENMEVRLLDTRRALETYSRYDAIVNLKTSGPCAPYITYPGRQL